DEFKSNVSMGSSFVGRVAERKKPFISDNAPGDADRVDSEWIRRENIKSIAAYPLMVSERVVGVLAVYSKNHISDAIAGELSLAAKGVSQFIQRKQSEEKLRIARDELSQYTGSLEKLTAERTASLREMVQQME